jgi:hypothetical protein
VSLRNGLRDKIADATQEAGSDSAIHWTRKGADSTRLAASRNSPSTLAGRHGCSICGKPMKRTSADVDTPART